MQDQLHKSVFQYDLNRSKANISEHCPRCSVVCAAIQDIQILKKSSRGRPRIILFKATT